MTKEQLEVELFEQTRLLGMSEVTPMNTYETRLTELKEQIRQLEAERDALIIDNAPFQPGDVVTWQSIENGPTYKGRIARVWTIGSRPEYDIYRIRNDGTEARFVTHPEIPVNMQLVKAAEETAA